MKQPAKHIIRLLFVFGLSFFVLSKTTNAQCSVKIVSPATNICLGDTISIYALGGCGSMIVEHFNDSSLGNQLSANHAVSIGFDCKQGIDGTPYIWFGSQFTGPHYLTTGGLNLSAGSYQVCFDMRYGEEGAGGICEGPSAANEAVRLQYSLNNGGSWTDIQSWDPNGGHDPARIQWGHYCVNIPAAALSGNTMIRWAQTSNTAINTANWGIDNIVIKKNQTTTFHWSNGYYGPNLPPIHPNTAGTYTVTAYDGAGCSCTDSITISPYPRPSATFNFTGKTCKNSPITFAYTGSAGSTASYNWNFPGPNTIVSGSQTVKTVEWNKTGTYYPSLVVTKNGCSSKPNKQRIDINPLVGFFTDKSEGCEPLTIHFKGNAYPKNSIYYWDFGDGGTSTDSTPVYTYVQDGKYSLRIIVESPDGCRDTMSFPDFIDCYPKPEVDFSFSPPIVPLSDPRVEFSNQTLYGSSYLWDFGDNSQSTQTAPLHTYSAKGDYIVWLWATSDKNCKDSLSKVVRVVEDLYKVPNIITPNGDGYNDYFVVENLEHLLECEVMIFNRWGNPVYQNHAYDNSWKGDNLPDGVYFYIVKYKSYFGTEEVRGTLRILRGK